MKPYKVFSTLTIHPLRNEKAERKTKTPIHRAWLVTLAAAVAIVAIISLSSCAGYTTNAGGGKTGTPGSGVVSPSATTLSFGGVSVGSSATQSLTLTNSGTATVNISQVAISGSGFTLSGGSNPTSIPVGQSVTAQVQFAPQSAGAITGALVVTSDASNSPLSVSLTGTGNQAGLTISPTSVTFGSVTDGQSATQTVKLTNSGNSNLVVNLATVSGTGYAVSGLSLPSTIAAGQSLSFSAQFAPTVAGAASGTISFTDNAPNSPQTISLSGTGVATSSALTATPSSVSFGSIVLGSNGKQTITLANSGNASIAISAVTASGSGFSVSGITTPLNLAAGQNTTFSVQCAPPATGNYTGSVAIASNASNPQLTIGLTGTGIQGTLAATPASVGFGSVLVGSSDSVPITLANGGTASVTISAASVSGTGFSISGLSTPLTINAGQNASFTAKFAPAAAGSVSGSISISSNAPNSPLAIALTGTATAAQPQLTISPASVPFGNVLVGGNASQTITLSNPGNAALTISAISASGAAFSLSGISAPATINAGANTSFSAKFAPTTAGSASGSITITSNASGSPATIALSGTGTQGSLAASPSPVNFGSVVLGSNGTQTITLTNSGTASVTISAATVAGTGFSIAGLSVPLTITAGLNATFTAQYSPSAVGSASGSISITSSAPNSPLTISLSGTGTQGTLTASPSPVNFGSVVLGSNATQTITLTNSGTASITISAASVSGTGFSITGPSTPLTINAGLNASFTATFTPTAAGSASGSISITSNAPNSPLTVSLTGTGTQAQLAAAPTSASFGSVTTGQSNSQIISLTNGGSASVTISQATVSGSGFSISGLTVPATIAVGKNTTFSVVFAPTTTGSVSGSVSLTSNAPNSPLTIALSGTGAAATYLLGANPTTLNFGNVDVSNNDPLSVTLTNSGNSNVTISTVSTSGTGFSASGVSNGTILTPNQTATVTVAFDPTAVQTYSGTLTITSTATNSPATVPLAGAGINPPPTSGSNPTCGTSATIGASGGNPAAMLSGDTTGHAPPDYTSFLPGAQGTTWTDQQFGCVITRVTNAVSDGNTSSQSEHHYYIPSALNQNDDRMVVTDEGGSVYVTDLSAHKVVSGGLSGYNATSAGASVYWGRAAGEAYTLYWKASDGTHNVLRKADTTACTSSSPCSSLTVTTVYTSTCPAGSFNGGNEDDMRANIQTGNEFVEWDCTSGGNLQMGVLNVTTATLGTMKTYSGNTGFDSTKIVSQPTPSTDMFLCWTNGGTGSYGAGNYGNGFWCYSGSTMSNEVQVTSNGQHANTVYDPAVNKSYLVMEQSGNDPTKNPCTWSNIASGWEEMELGNSANPHVCLLTFPSWATETHVSGGDHGLASLEIYQDAGTSPQILNANDSLDANYASDWLPLIGEVILLNTSNKTVYRVADHRSRMNACGGGSGTQNYWAVPRSSLSIDNKYVVFDSNMTRDGSPQPACNSINNYTDVYMIAIHP